jgi:hypothetical protein
MDELIPQTDYQRRSPRSQVNGFLCLDCQCLDVYVRCSMTQITKRGPSDGVSNHEIQNVAVLELAGVL